MTDVLSDDGFGVGFELEFVVADFDRLYTAPKVTQVAELSWDRFLMGFDVTNKRRAIEVALANAEYDKPQWRWEDNEDRTAKRVGWAKLIAFFKLKPRYGYWYFQNRYGVMLDRTEKVNKLIDELDVRDEAAIRRAARSIGRHYVFIPPVGKYDHVELETQEAARRLLASHLGHAIGHQITYVENNSDGDSKKRPDWYLKEEYMEDVRCYQTDGCLELTTPVMLPGEALNELETTMRALLTMPFDIYTGPDCGLHVNISHTDVSLDGISGTAYGLMEEYSVADDFPDRMAGENCESVRVDIMKVIKELIQEKIISLSGFDRDPEGTLRLIDATWEMRKTNSMNLGNMYDHGYAEYRIPGGPNYLNRYDDIKNHILKLLTLHRHHPEAQRSVLPFLRVVLKRHGAEANDGVALTDNPVRHILRV